MRETCFKLQSTPIEHSVIATELSRTWIWGRKSVTRWPDTELIPNHCPDRVVILESEAKIFQKVLSKCPMTLLQSKQICSFGDWIEIKLN